jgi:hypothetical protein
MVVDEDTLKKATKKLKEKKKLEKIWTRFKMARRMARRNGKRLSIEVFNEMVDNELGKD